MFIVNFKLNSNRIIIALCILILVIILFISASNIYPYIPTVSNIIKKHDINVTTDSFVKDLRLIYDNIDNNVGKSIKVSGFIFKLDDFKSNQFVVGRDMNVGGQDKVVGFMCEYDKTSDLKTDKWYELTGEIIKGNYQGDIPIIKILNIKEIPAPKNTFVS